MIWVNQGFLLVLLGWSIFAPFVCIFIGWRARGDGAEEWIEANCEIEVKAFEAGLEAARWQVAERQRENERWKPWWKETL